MNKPAKNPSSQGNQYNLTIAQKRRIRKKNFLARLAKEKKSVENINSVTDACEQTKELIIPVENQSGNLDYSYSEINRNIPNMPNNNSNNSSINTRKETKKKVKTKITEPYGLEENVKSDEITLEKDSPSKQSLNQISTSTKSDKSIKTSGKDLSKDKAILESPKTKESNNDPSANESLDVKQDVIIVRGKDEVDRIIKLEKENEIPSSTKLSREHIKAEREAKKLAKQAKKKVSATSEVSPEKPVTKEISNITIVKTLEDIVEIAKEVQDVASKINKLKVDDTADKLEEQGKSKAELRAERRAKQEAQRAAKLASQSTGKISQSTPPAATKEKPEKNISDTPKSSGDVPKIKVDKKPVKGGQTEKSKIKSVNSHKVNWFQHLYTDHDKESLKKITLNSKDLHPVIVKLGVQLATRVISGSNARCIALLSALRQVVTDYTLPAKTEFGRGLDAHLVTSLNFLWKMREPTASMTNAIKYFRFHLTQLPNNVIEFDAKKTLQEAIDTYIRDQIDVAGEAISIAVRNKISSGDNVLTYGCSSLIEKILKDAWSAGVEYRAVIVGSRSNNKGREMLRRLTNHGIPCTYVNITAISFVMRTINKVLLGASSLLVNGSVLGAIGTAQVAIAAQAFNVPVLVCCETHKFSERVQTDAFVYNEIGDPDELIDMTDDNSPLKDWKSQSNLTPLNLTYDVTPPELVTAVVTELAILPCTSAPVVLRFKLSEYGFDNS